MRWPLARPPGGQIHPEKPRAKAKLPVDKGYADGKEIYFAHTEASDAKLAEKMAAGMQSPVIYVPTLAHVTDHALANVYVFTNGVKGKK